jgi:hypothetical protein
MICIIFMSVQQCLKDKLRYVRPPLWFSGQEFLTTDPEVPGSISGPTIFSEK